MTIPPSIWRTIKLTPKDWLFNQCKSDSEYFDCRNWEYSREESLIRNNGAWPDNPNKTRTHRTNDDDYRRAQFDERLHRELIDPKWHWHRDWPKKPYLEVRPPISKEFQRREIYKEDLAAILQMLSGPEWKDYSRILPRRRIFWPFPNTETVAISVPWKYRNDDLIRMFREWLIQNRPSQFPEPEKPRRATGRGADISQCKKDLLDLAAYRLVSHFGNQRMAWKHASNWNYLGIQFQPMSTAWSESKDRVARALGLTQK